ncbi:MAG: DNA polymerase III subunit alpha [Alphaproteobacteria bacterium]|nr:DNA polymerase III subunit alpha [Alphaproteobacteria bacterium]
MSHADFVHLRVHTAYSLSEGAITVKGLVKLCQAQRMPAVGLADTNNLFGALEFSVACAEAGVQPLIGCQLAVRREEGEERRIGQRDGRLPPPDPVVLLAQNATGYAHLLKLVSKAFLSSGDEPPQVSLDDLAVWADGLLLLTGGAAGPVGRLLAEGAREKAESLLRRLAEAFPGRTYVELMRHGLDVEDRIEAPLVDLAYRLDLPLVATNEPFFADAGMYEAHDALLCIAEGTYVSQTDRRRLTPEHRFKSAEEMRALFADLPEAVDNTLVVARRCAFKVEKHTPILPPYHTRSGRSEAEELRELSREGLEKRLAVHVFKEGATDHDRDHAARLYRERLDYELKVIEQMGFPGYFLIVADFIQWAKGQGIPVGPGRGSGAGSAVAWALGITDLDPLRFGLLFERFLNPERVSMPDFDVDFCQDRREEVIRYVQRKYGYMNVAQIITFGKLQARAALRDVGRVLQMPYGQVDRISKLVPNGSPAAPITIKDALASEPRLRDMRDGEEVVRQMLDIAMKLEGLYRHASTHAAGVVIGDRSLDELVPLYRDPRSEMPVTQFNMKWVESAGLVKFDFLGLKTLTVLARAVDLVERTTGARIDLSALPLDDRPTFEMLGHGDTSGIFQLESTGMRDVVRSMKPDTLEEIIAIVALYRPGPMDNIPSYIKRKHGQEAIDYLYPTLKPILEETFGIIVYQEQVMQIAQELSGYSLGGADLLRRAMGKKIRSEMEDQRKVFVDGAVAKGVEPHKASDVFDLVAKFAEYGFNKSHAAAYAVVAYQTAYLKANHPVEFMAASMTLDMHNTDKLGLFRQELERLGIKLLPPDINKSEAVFGVEGKAVRYALGAIRNVGAAAMEDLVREREEHGPFKDLSDFARRMDGRALNRRQLENLIKAGAFDGLEPNRARLFDGMDHLLREAAAAAQERASNQTSLFGEAAAAPPLGLPKRSDWPPMERLGHEFDAIGFYLSAHPLDAYGSALDRLKVVRAADLAKKIERGGGGALRMVGTVVSRKERTGKNGSRYAFIQFSDASGAFEATLFSEVLASSREVLESGSPVLITLDARLDEEQLRLTVHKVESLDAAVARSAKRLVVVIGDETAIPPIGEAVRREGRGRGEIVLVPLVEGREVEILLPGAYALSPAIIGAVKNMPGVVEVREI